MPAAGEAHFAFDHRFRRIGEDGGKFVNYPTLRLGVGLPAEFAIGTTYTTNSDLGEGTANEGELWLRWAFPVARSLGLAATLAYNTAAAGVDGELAARARAGPFTLLAVARGFSDAYGSEDAATALGGGVLWHLTPRLALAADGVRVVSTDTLPTAWGAGIHLAVPGTPHTLAIVVSNVGVTTLRGSSRGLEDEDGTDLRWGFAFTVPLGSAERWAGVFRGAEPDRPAADAAAAPAPAGGAVHRVTIRDFAFSPAELRVRAGDTVVWTNEDPVVHTVTADSLLDGAAAFDSDSIPPGGAWVRRFEAPGERSYHCTPHPFMKGVVRVIEAAEDGGE